MNIPEVMKQALKALEEAHSLYYIVAHQETEVGIRAESNGPFIAVATANLRASIEQMEKAEPVAFRGMACEVFLRDSDADLNKGQWFPARFIATDLHGGEPIVQIDKRLPCFATWGSVRGITKEMVRTHPAPAVPTGWKIVPIEPTPEMIEAYCNLNSHFPSAIEDWKAMLSAAPEAPK